VGALLLTLGVRATAGPPQPTISPVSGLASSVAARPDALAVTSLGRLERVTGRYAAWTKLLLIGSGLLSLGVIVRKRLLGEESDTDIA
jgi:hypothetical protein